MNALTRVATTIAELGAPDRLVRAGMRRVIQQRLEAEGSRTEADRTRMLQRWHDGPIALVPEIANAQHYEVPVGFFELILGPYLKYSSCLWQGATDLAAAEESMLQLTAERAGIHNGMRILDLGSGWGSLSLWLAERYPAAEIVAVSNSSSQGDFIRKRATARGLENLEHRVVNVNELDLDGPFDAVVSVEMLEHVRNHPRLLQHLQEIAVPGATMTVHVFAHRELFWEFEDRGPGDWMARNFFSGGVMPSHAGFHQLIHPFEIEDSWWINGTNYARTLDAWLQQLDNRRPNVETVLKPVYGSATRRWVQRWRMFLMASSEFFGYANGDLLGVSHHRIRIR